MSAPAAVTGPAGLAAEVDRLREMVTAQGAEIQWLWERLLTLARAESHTRKTLRAIMLADLGEEEAAPPPAARHLVVAR